MVSELRELIEALRHAKTSKNSSKPPSSDGPGAKTGAPKAPSGRKPGGQPGHGGSRRQLLAPEKVDAIVEHWPTQCRGCARALPASGRDASDPVRHQVTELPAKMTTVTEHRLHAQACRGCRALTRATLPVEVPRGAFGWRLQGVVATLTGGFRLSKRNAAALCRSVFGVELSLGSVSAIERGASYALAAPVAQAQRFVQAQPVLHVDETGWREQGARAWLWVAVSSLVTVFLVHRRRNKEAAEELLGDFDGRLVADRWSAYAGRDDDKRQVCWAHLKRDFQWIAEHSGAAGRLGCDLLDVERRVFTAWHAHRDGAIGRPQLRRRIAPLRLELDGLLKRGMRGGRARVEGMCREIWLMGDALWTFAAVEGVEPTNNAAERALRHAVIWRKTSFGSHAESGSRFVERMLSVVATLKQQGRGLLDYVAAALAAASARREPPSLLPAG